MKISLGALPFNDSKNRQILQNRQYQVYRNKTRIYPVIHAYAATMLHEIGHEIVFNPTKFVPSDVVVWEVKTPVVKAAWDRVNHYKHLYPKTRFILCGDHVAAMPEETLSSCDCEVLRTGNYDTELCELLSPNHIWDGQPLINRELTNWKDYAYHNGNFTKTPGAYTMFGRDCWWGKCTFCSWATLYPCFETITPRMALSEVDECMKLGVMEIFDDTGTFPTGGWLHEFCEKAIVLQERNEYNMRFGCNMRFGACNEEEYLLMRRAGFSMLLFGVESGNQGTLDRLNKGIKIKDIENGLRMATRAGLKPHVTFMVGYPWEDVDDVEQTVRFARSLFRQGLIESLQATVVMPYPNTPLWKEANENGWLLSKDWSDYDMSKPIIKTEYDSMGYVKKLYRSCLTPKFVMKNAFKVKRAIYWMGHI